jgi:hypothetical protein
MLILALLFLQEFKLDENGAHLQNEAFELNFGGRYMLIGRFILDDPNEAVVGSGAGDVFRETGFFTRQARIDFWGTLRKTWEFKVSADLVSSTPTLADGYVGYIGTSWLKVRVGQQKTPQGIEQPGNLMYSTMVDRYPGDMILPGRDLGIKAWGLVLDDIFQYELMVADGNATVDQNKSIGQAGPSDGMFEFLMQITLFPGKIWEWPFLNHSMCGYFHGVGEGDDLALPDLRTRDTGTRILDFDNNSTFPGGSSPPGTTVQDGQRERDGVFFAWSFENFGVQGEWVRVDMTLRNLGGPNARDTVYLWAWFVDVVWIVTGEEKVFNRRITPKEPLHEGAPARGSWRSGSGNGRCRSACACSSRRPRRCPSA